PCPRPAAAATAGHGRGLATGILPQPAIVMPRSRRQSTAMFNGGTPGMDAWIEARLLELLGRNPNRAIPMDRLHRLLADEVGPGVNGYLRLRRAVAARPDAFVLLEPASPFGDGLTTELRAAYADAIDAALLAPAARVALAVHETHEPGDRPGIRRATLRTEEEPGPPAQ